MIKGFIKRWNEFRCRWRKEHLFTSPANNNFIRTCSCCGRYEMLMVSARSSGRTTTRWVHLP